MWNVIDVLKNYIKSILEVSNYGKVKKKSTEVEEVVEDLVNDVAEDYMTDDERKSLKLMDSHTLTTRQRCPL